jgi:hypothetical protein
MTTRDGRTRPCSNRVDPEDPESAECGDEYGYCPSCEAKADAYWRNYFGLRDGMTPAEERKRLEGFRPVTAADHFRAWEEKRGLKR